MCFFRKNKIEIVDDKVISLVGDIGRMKKELPMTQRGWCNQLGLYVQLNEVMGYGKLEAGYRTKAFFRATRDDPFGEWKVKRYENGDWERLVEPAHQLTWWMSQMGGLPEDLIPAFELAVEQFQQTGELNLPENE